MEEKVISVIIPVYNTPLILLQKCLDSLFCQQDYIKEIIIVDSSIELDVIDFLKELNNSKDIVRLLKSEKGVSIQRNIGLNEAKGEFIAFVDSDDFVSTNYFSEMLSFIRIKDADIAYPLLIKVTISKNYSIFKQNVLMPKIILSSVNEDNFFVQSSDNQLVNPVKLYKRNIIGNTRFKENLIHGEDMFFNFDLAIKGFGAVFVESAKYYFSSIEGNNAARKRLSYKICNTLQLLWSLYRKNRRNYSKQNLDGIKSQFNYLFSSYFYEIVKNNSWFLCIRFLKYRFIYLHFNFTIRNSIYVLFPLIFKILRKILRRK